MPVGPLAAAREGDPRVRCLRPHGLTAGGDPGRPRRGRRGRRGRARKTARQRAWAPAGEHSPAAGVWADRPPVIDIGATLVGVHSTSIRRNGGCGPDPFKKGLGDRPPDRMVRPRHWQRRRRSARRSCCAPAFPGRSTSADHVEIIRRALDQAGPGPRPGRRVLARTDGAGGTKKTIEPLTRRRASCSVGVHPARPHTADPRAPSPRPPGHPRTTPTATPGTGRTPPRPADPPDLTGWPQGMRANRAPRAAPPGWPAALRGHRRSYRPPPSPPTQKEAGSQASRPATGHEPAAREPHPPHKRHPARPRPFAGPRAKPYLAPDHGPGPQTCRPSPRRRPWQTPPPTPGNPSAFFTWAVTVPEASARAWEPRTIPLRLTSIPAAITHHTRRTVPHHKTDRPRNTLPLDNLRHLQTPPAP